jgi:hypothetical protein
MLIQSTYAQMKRPDPRGAEPWRSDPRAAGLPTVLLPKADLEAAAAPSPPPPNLPAWTPPAPADQLVAIPPDLVAWCTDEEVQGALRGLVGDGVRQLSPLAGQVYDGAFLVFGGKTLVEQWLDPAKSDPWELLIDTMKWLSGIGAAAAVHVPVLAPYRAHLETLGFGCSIAGIVYKGRARLGSSEGEVIAEVHRAILGRVAPSPAALAYALANTIQRLPPVDVRRG